MLTKKDPLEELAQAIAARVKQHRATPKFRVIEQPKRDLFDSITRESCLRRIRFLRNAYQLTWLVDQATFDVANVECLGDREISALLNDMERARECIAENISFEDAGLIRKVRAPDP